MKFEYVDLEIPNFLLMHLGENTDFSATLMPRIPELIAVREGYYAALGEENARKIIDLNLDPEIAKTLELSRLYVKNRIKPFWELRFEGLFGLTPKAECNLCDFLRNARNARLFEELFEVFYTPCIMANNERWSAIHFDNAGQEQKSSATVAKRAVRKFIEQGYIVTSFIAHLNPQYGTSDHYYGRFECDGSIIVDRGEIRLSGKAKGDFNPNDVPRNYPKGTEDNLHRDLEALAISHGIKGLLN